MARCHEALAKAVLGSQMRSPAYSTGISKSWGNLQPVFSIISTDKPAILHLFHFFYMLFSGFMCNITPLRRNSEWQELGSSMMASFQVPTSITSSVHSSATLLLCVTLTLIKISFWRIFHTGTTFMATGEPFQTITHHNNKYLVYACRRIFRDVT